MISVTNTDLHLYVQGLEETVERHRHLEQEHRDLADRAQLGLERAKGFVAEFTEWKDGIPGVNHRNTKRHGHISGDDLTHCESQAEALREIARRSGGYCNATEAAPIVIEAGLTKSKKLNSVASTLQKVLANESEWYKPTRGLYVWKQFQASEDRELVL